MTRNIGVSIKRYILMLSMLVITMVFTPFCFATDDSAQDILPNASVNDTVLQQETVHNNNEAKHVFSKFGHSMLLMLGSCLVIFLVLYAIKQKKQRKMPLKREIDITKDLNSPQTIEEATKFFIEKF